MDSYPDIWDVWEDGYVGEQFHGERRDSSREDEFSEDEGVLGDDPFKETPTCGKCGRFMDCCICPDHVWNSVPF